jgi:broad specificity phosphatase PhoE
MRSPPMSVRLILIRHGLTAWNLAGRYQGRTNTSLCAAGLAEAHGAGTALRHAPASLVLTSPLRRARATAEVICRHLGSIPCHVDERLVELGFGEWEGLTQAEVRRRWPTLLRDWKRAPQSVRFPGGEGLADGLRRVQDFLRSPPWAAGTAPRCVIAVTHTGPIRLARLCADGRSLAEYRQVALQAGAAHQFDWEPSGQLRPAGLLPLT